MPSIISLTCSILDRSNTAVRTALPVPSLATLVSSLDLMQPARSARPQTRTRATASRPSGCLDIECLRGEGGKESDHCTFVDRPAAGKPWPGRRALGRQRPRGTGATGRGAGGARGGREGGGERAGGARGERGRAGGAAASARPGPARDTPGRGGLPRGRRPSSDPGPQDRILRFQPSGGMLPPREGSDAPARRPEGT